VAFGHECPRGCVQPDAHQAAQVVSASARHQGRLDPALPRPSPWQVAPGPTPRCSPPRPNAVSRVPAHTDNQAAPDFCHLAGGFPSPGCSCPTADWEQAPDSPSPLCECPTANGDTAAPGSPFPTSDDVMIDIYDGAPLQYFPAVGVATVHLDAQAVLPPAPAFRSVATKRGILEGATSLGVVAFVRTKALVRRRRTTAGIVSPPVHSEAFVISAVERALMFSNFPLASEVPEVVAALTGKRCRRYGPEYPTTLARIRRARVAAANVAKWNALAWARLCRSPFRADPVGTTPPPFPAVLRPPQETSSQHARRLAIENDQLHQARDALTQWCTAPRTNPRNAHLGPRRVPLDRALVFVQNLWPTRADLRQQLLDMMRAHIRQPTPQGDPTIAGRPAAQ
jgi:hypothetical protein